MPMKDAVDFVVAVAMAHWSGGDYPQGFDSDAWYVQLTRIEGSDDITCIVVGHGTDGGRVQSNVNVHAKGHVVPNETAEQRELGEIIRSRATIKSVVIKYAHCSLYAPAGKYAEGWARAQVGLWFLQRDWRRSEEDEAWVWTDCLCPVLKMIPAGRRALEDAELGYELQLAFLKNYMNPHRPGGFQAYVRTTIRRIAGRRSKAERAEHRDPLDMENPFKSEAFRAFIRQRKRRGHPGIGVHESQIVGTREAVESLQLEYAHIIGRKRFVKDAARLMERRGAECRSAERQVRRWLRDEGGPEGATKRLNAWIRNRDTAGVAPT
jgi:hypothetical protein